jgi:hypothetical protein
MEVNSQVHAVGLSCDEINETRKTQSTNDRSFEGQTQSGHVGLEGGRSP